ncbi:MAG: DUF2934 domain-containing protein [candidate division Zixibacteria bacterium]|nr:DUF2934 domain-containing protein [candidate division Zixibacteria bacterium]
MTSEIRRNIWSRFCKKFSTSNMYRPAKLHMGEESQDKTGSTQDFPFLGMTMEKKGRLIDGFNFFAGCGDTESIAQPITSIKQPAKVVLEKDESGNDTRLTINSKDGTETTIELYGEKDPNQYRDLVGRVAYSLYEKRNYSHGNDRDDWLEAERKIRNAQMIITQ